MPHKGDGLRPSVPGEQSAIPAGILDPAPPSESGRDSGRHCGQDSARDGYPKGREYGRLGTGLTGDGREAQPAIGIGPDDSTYHSVE